jgi:hypothetical protein
MKNYLKFSKGDRVKIIRTHSDDLNKLGTIVEVRPSFCKILLDGATKSVNHTYGQFSKVEEELKDETNS